MNFAVSQYRTARIETASPIQIVVQLYDGCIKFLRQAEVAIEGRDYAKKGVALSKAHAIVSELQATLDSEQAPELCAQLDSLYDFVLNQITEANVKSDATFIGPAIRVMSELREAWAQVAKDQK